MAEFTFSIAPYLLFYPDANRDDVPDGNPQVLLSGFGMEDAQSMSNHLTWGPDGWLYGVNGSTTTCHIRGLEFQQGVWRFHPVTHEFELFCEGGSNCYGLTFDANGELFYSTNGGPFVHAVQGGYFYKSFGKHGPLHNLHAYHYFPELERDQVPGGPPTGGTIYLADAFPQSVSWQLHRRKFPRAHRKLVDRRAGGKHLPSALWRRAGRFARHLVRPNGCVHGPRRGRVLQ